MDRRRFTRKQGSNSSEHESCENHQKQSTKARDLHYILEMKWVLSHALHCSRKLLYIKINNSWNYFSKTQEKGCGYCMKTKVHLKTREGNELKKKKVTSFPNKLKLTLIIIFEMCFSLYHLLLLLSVSTTCFWARIPLQYLSAFLWLH